MQRDALIDPARLGAAATSWRTPTLVRGGESDVLSDFLERRIRSRLSRLARHPG